VQEDGVPSSSEGQRQTDPGASGADHPDRRPVGH
jgi:hypothetical protein